MKKFFLFSLIIMMISVYSGCKKNNENPNQSPNEITDPRDGQTYATVKIGTQTWFAKNLNYETANSWWYENDPANGKIYGRLYAWDAAINACPKGWHLPSDDEWKTLEMYLGMTPTEADATGLRGTDEGKKMKSTSGWFDLNSGTNSSGFNALPGGYRDNTSGVFNYLIAYGEWWSSSERLNNSAWHRMLYWTFDQVERTDRPKTFSYSVRCVKN